MLAWRLAMSALLIPLFAGLFWLDHRAGAAAPVLYVVCLLIAFRCAWELVRLLRPRFPEARFAPCAVAIAAVLTAAWCPHWFRSGPDAGTYGDATLEAMVLVGLVYGGCVLGLFALEAWRYTQPGARMETLAAHVLIVSYLGFLLAMTAQTRWVAGPDAGYLLLGAMVIATKMGDTGAYTCGRLFGRRKMAPHLSPGKTWAGFAGALVGGALGAWAWLHFAGPQFGSAAPPWYVSIPFGVVLGFVGLLGDLCESLIKRDMGQKDAAPLMPGFGGLLDLLDSILFTGPVAYVWWLVFTG